MKKATNTGKPFFSLFLEIQEKKEQEELSNKEKEALTGGGRKPPYQTQKYPSDGDDDIYLNH